MKKFCKLTLVAMLAVLGLSIYGCKPEPIPTPAPIVNPGDKDDTGGKDDTGTGDKDDPGNTDNPIPDVPDPTPDNGPAQPSNPHDGSFIWMGLVRATTSTVSVAWTIEEKNASCMTSCYPSSSYDPTKDITKQYRASIYSDEACANLIVSWTLNPGLGTSSATFSTSYPPRFCFSGLKPSSTYYIMVENLTDKTKRNKPFAVKTADPLPGTVVTSNAKAGDLILSESFDALMYGGDLTTFSAGYSRTDRSTLASPAIPSGTDPDKTDDKFYTVGASTEMGLFNTMKGLIDDYGLENWSMIAGGTNMGTILERPGFLKVGANSQHGYIITPKLNALDQAATIDVTFKAAPYGGTTIDESEKAMRVQVFDGGVIGATNVLEGASESDFYNVILQGGRGDWTTYTVRLENVTNESRIGFGGIGTAAQSRFNIDDIQIKVVDVYAKKPSGYYAEGNITYTDGKPAVGVSVSDGFNVAITDANGHYVLTTRKDTWYIYFSYPSDAKITTVNGCPAFFTRYSAAKHTYDFSFERITPEKKFMLFALADPQAHYAKRSGQGIADTDRFIQETVPALNNQIAAQSLPCYGVTLGDIVYSEGSRNSNPGMTIMRGHFSKVNMPVFQSMGNHDFTYFYSSSALKTDDFSSTLYLRAQRNFEDIFGPVNFSFNRGDVHIVCMRNINYDSPTDASSYHGGFSDDQYKWLVADLANVPKSKKIILCVHIPVLGITSRENVSAVLNLMKQYTNSEIFSGHTHYKRGYANVGSSGIYEHVHSAVCGQWWWSNVEGDGCPNGYTVYYVNGTNFDDEYFTGFNNHMNTRDYQIRMYRGNCKTGGANVYFQWPHTNKTLLINIFNGDSRWKKVEVYEDGVLSGNASLMSNKKTSFTTTKGQTYTVSADSSQDWWAIGYNMGVVGRGLGSSTSYFTTCMHMYKYILKSETSKVEVRATDPYGNVYKCTELIENGTAYPEYVKVGNH